MLIFSSNPQQEDKYADFSDYHSFALISFKGSQGVAIWSTSPYLFKSSLSKANYFTCYIFAIQSIQNQFPLLVRQPDNKKTRLSKASTSPLFQALFIILV